MKRPQKITLLLSIIFITSCTSNLFREKVGINYIIKAKEAIDIATNPAKQLILRNELSKKIVILKNIKVKDIIQSPNIDYNFCVVTEIKTEKGDIECFIFTKNIRIISQLEKGKTTINVEGEFNRYFSMLDSYYTKIEIINSTIEIIEP